MKLPSDAKGGDGERGSGGCPESIGIGGRLESESVADLPRNTLVNCTKSFLALLTSVETGHKRTAWVRRL